MSPSPFKWEVSGRALRTVSVGEPEQKVTGSERARAPLRSVSRTFTHRFSVLSLCTQPSSHTHPPLSDSLHGDGPERHVESEPLSHSTVCEELQRERKKGEDGSLCSISLVESSGRSGTGEWNT